MTSVATKILTLLTGVLLLSSTVYYSSGISSSKGSFLKQTNYQINPIVDGSLSVTMGDVDTPDSVFTDICDQVLQASKKDELLQLGLNFNKDSYLSYTRLDNIDEGLKLLGQITTLTSLNLSMLSNHVKTVDFSPLEALTNLTSMTINMGNNLISNETIDNLSFLGGLTKLTNLNLDYNNNKNGEIQNLDGLKCLENLVNLERFKLVFETNTGLTNVDALSSVVAFKKVVTFELQFQKCAIKSIKSLNLSGLVSTDSITINFNENKIVDDELFEIGILPITRWFFLDLAHNDIKNANSLRDLNGAAGLTKINFNFANLNLQNLDFLRDLEDMTELLEFTINADYNIIPQVHLDMKRWERLCIFIFHLKSCQVETLDIKFSVGKMPILRSIELRAENNKIKSIETLKTIKDLETLTDILLLLGQNEIESINFLDGFTNPILSHIQLGVPNNQINDLSPAESLADLPKIQRISLSFINNPVGIEQCEVVKDYIWDNVQAGTSVSIGCEEA